MTTSHMRSYRPRCTVARTATGQVATMRTPASMSALEDSQPETAGPLPARRLPVCNAPKWPKTQSSYQPGSGR
jgi:hypothetical protein